MMRQYSDETRASMLRRVQSVALRARTNWQMRIFPSAQLALMITHVIYLASGTQPRGWRTLQTHCMRNFNRMYAQSYVADIYARINLVQHANSHTMQYLRCFFWTRFKMPLLMIIFFPYRNDSEYSFYHRSECITFNLDFDKVWLRSFTYAVSNRDKQTWVISNSWLKQR